MDMYTGLSPPLNNAVHTAVTNGTSTQIDRQLSASDATNITIPQPRPSSRRVRPRVPDDLRKRIARACTECRRKKEKCDGKLCCERCLRHRISCRYETVGRQRVEADARGAPRLRPPRLPLSPKERLHCMEKIFAHCLVGRDLGDDELFDLANSVPDLTGTFSNPPGPEQDSPPADGISTAAASQASTEPCEDLSLHKFAHRLASAIEEKEQSDGILPADGRGPAHHLLPRPRQPRLPRSPRSSSTVPHPSASYTPDQLVALTASLNAFPPREIAVFLLDVFFRYTQTSLYYVEEAWVYQFVESCYMDFPSSPGSVIRGREVVVDDIPSVCTVLLVMACGTQFAHLASASRGIGALDSANGRDATHILEDGIARRFYTTAGALMPYVLSGPVSASQSLQSVQACLMMATYNFSLDSAGASYTYLSLSLSLAVQLGLHDGRGFDKMDAVVAEVHRRTWWTVYILHVQVSIKYGRPAFLSFHWAPSLPSLSSMPPSPITVTKPVDLPELRPPAGSPAVFANQRGLIELTLATQAIADETTRLRQTNRAVHFLNLLSIRQQLVRWWETFGVDSERINRAADAVPDSDVDVRRLRNDIHLHLYYWNARLSLGRPFLLLQSNDASSSTSLGKATLIQDALTGALEIVRLSQLLRDHVGLARASYVTEFTCCRTAMLVLLAQGLAQGLAQDVGGGDAPHPPHTIRETLSRGLSILKLMAAGGSSLARCETRVIEALERAVDRLEAALQRKRRQEHAERVARDRQRLLQSRGMEEVSIGTVTEAEGSAISSMGGDTQGWPNNRVDYDTFRTWSRLWQVSSGLTPSDVVSNEDAEGEASGPASGTSVSPAAASTLYPTNTALHNRQHQQQQHERENDSPASSFAHTHPMLSQFPESLANTAVCLEQRDIPVGSHLFGSLPLELSQFNIIPGLDLEAYDFSDTPDVNYGMNM